MITTNLTNTTQARSITQTKGIFSIMEYNKDISVTTAEAQTAYFASEMNIRKRQLIATLNGNSVIVQAGAMQLMIGALDAGTDIKGAGDLLKKALSSKVTGETAIKPKYSGKGQLVLEPTYKHIILEDLKEWKGAMVIDDGLFLASEGTVDMKVVARTTLSSAIAGGEGLFNSCLTGTGVVALESPVPYDELISIDLVDDCVKIDGNMAIAWSNSLKFTVERTTKTLVGSAASGEGLVNVYRGTGRILIAPIA